MNDDRQTNKKIKIVRIIARLNVGGPARHVVWLTKALQNGEFQSVLLTGTVPGGEEDMSYFAAENGVEPVFIEEMSRELSPKDVVSLWKVYQRICREKPDIIHTHTAKAGTVGRAAGFLYRWLTWQTLIGKPRRVKFVHTYHGHVFHSYYGNLKTKIFLFIEKTLASLATDKIVVISRQQFGEIHEQFGVGRTNQFEIVPLGIDLAPFEQAREKRDVLRAEIGADDDEILVGLVGRLTEIKNIPLFLRVAELYKEQGENSGAPRIRFVVVGEGHLRASLEKEAETLQIKDITVFLGNRSDTDVFYAGLDIVALTSLNEGTPLSLIEAMANGRAVISTEVGGVVDLLGAAQAEEDGFKICERGVRVASNDAAGFYNGLSRLANDSQMRARAGANGKKFVGENYSKERLIRDIRKLYLDLI
ncbi:MAG: glycosyltransferase [Acidobacteriota bacterium]|nr:glycosyltransferase [Acidobacteriota bacterium]